MHRAHQGSGAIFPAHHQRLPAWIGEERSIKRWHFLVALLSCIAFVVGNMVGQHGWGAFWASVVGAYDSRAIPFAGTALPIARVVHPDHRYEPGIADLPAHKVPRNFLIPLPEYRSECPERVFSISCRVISVGYLRGYGTDRGSHLGVDIPLPRGTEVAAVANGIVDRAVERSWGFGNTVVLRHDGVPDPADPSRTTTLYSVYAHLDAIDVQVGQVVSKGDRIGASGQTGVATTPHLHFQVDRDTAPFHPYWAFTGREAREAGLTFFEAVDQGLGRERAKQYTIDPMAFVQRFRTWEGVRVVASLGEASGSGEPGTAAPLRRRILSVGDRREQRLARRSSQGSTLSTTPTSTTVAEATAVFHGAGEVPRLLFHHDRVFSRRWVKLRLEVEDNATFEGKVSLRTIFGRAVFDRPELSRSDFDAEGKAEVNVLIPEHKTVIFAAYGALTGQSAPLVYEGENVVGQ